MKISRFVALAGASIIVLSVGMAIINFVSSRNLSERSNQTLIYSLAQLDDFYVLAEVVRDLQLDVVQVQQWLTDISATRGLDGLDDGMEVAAGFAERFPHDIARGRAVAKTLEIPELQLILDELEAAFPPYYQAGIDMAAAYIQGGPKLGNPMMGEFDAVAEKIVATVEKMLVLSGSSESVYKNRKQKVSAQSREILGSMRGNTILVFVSNLVIALAVFVMIIFTVFVLLRKLADSNQKLLSLSAGKTDLDLTEENYWQEFKQLAVSISTFRDSLIKVSNLTQAEKDQSQIRARERADMMAQLGKAFGKVVSASAAGDFSLRVTTDFPDEELNRLAEQVNQLVETVERGLDETGKVLGALANTNLTKRVTGKYQGAFADLKRDTNAVGDRLGEIIGKLRETSGSLKQATSEILSGTTDLSERTSTHATMIEETSATMERLAGTVRDNSALAQKVGENADGVAQAAVDGVEVMDQATSAMAQITASSAKISNIIGMIEDIAFQTNLLALNASVESARAGEAGKGFAVVASEVRRLAQSTANASSDVKNLIDQSAREVDQGSKLVAKASEKLEFMKAGATKNKLIMAEVVTANKDQTCAIEEVNVAVRQMDEMTQHNASLVVQTNAAIAQTDNQVSQLDRVTEVFKIADSTGPDSSVSKPGQLLRGRAPVISDYQPPANKRARSTGPRTAAALNNIWGEF